METKKMCVNCKNAKLIRYGNDPTLAECGKKHDGRRKMILIASCIRKCSEYERAEGAKPTEIREKKYGLWV